MMSDKKYVLMKWADGWQEVIAVEEDAIGFDKYYVIERKEHFGRLVVERPKGQYPGLIVIDRAPMEVEKIALVDKDTELKLKQSSIYREGERLEYNYDLQEGQETIIEEVVNNIRNYLTTAGISKKAVLSKSDSERYREIENIAKAVSLVGGKNQADVVGFVELLLERI